MVCELESEFGMITMAEDGTESISRAENQKVLTSHRNMKLQNENIYEQQQRHPPPPNYHNAPSQGQSIVKLTSNEAASEAKKLKDSENFNLAIKVDKWSAVMFPVMFALFNMCYW